MLASSPIQTEAGPDQYKALETLRCQLATHSKNTPQDIMDRLIASMLQKSPKDRPTMTQVISELEKIIALSH